MNGGIMKKRIFYIIHLDKERILLLSIILGTLLITSFTAGYKIGIENKNQFQDISLVSPEITRDVEINTTNDKKNEIDNLSPPAEIEKVNKQEFSLEELKKSEKINIKSQLDNSKDKIIDSENLISKLDISNTESDVKAFSEPFKTKQKTTKTEVKQDEITKYDNQYYIQIAAFKSLEDLTQFKSRLEKNGILCNYKKNKKYYILYTYAKSIDEVENTKGILENFNINKVIVKKTK